MEKVTRILIAAPLYPPQIGGPATHAVLMESELPKRGFQVRVLPFSRVSYLPKGIKHLVYLILLLIKGVHADVIYALDPVSVGFPASIAAFVLKKRFVLRIGGDYAWEQGVSKYGITDSLDEYLKRTELPRRVRTLARVQRDVATSADVLIVPSNYLATVAQVWGVKRENIAVAHSTSKELTSIPRDVARKNLGVPENVFLMVSAGRLVPWKGFETLIKASCSTLKDSPALLAIAGDGPSKRSIEATLERYKAHSRVRLLGRQSRKDLSVWLSAADLFVLNTGYEGFSHQILEAMRMGLPVLTTSIGGNLELIESAVSGVLVQYNNEQELAAALVKLHGDREFREKIGNQGKKKSESFKEGDSVSIIVHALRP